MKGLKKCPNWLKKVYRRGVKYKCQQCHKSEEEVGTLIPHRIVRGYAGGLYTVALLNTKGNNIKVVCDSCHKLLHGNEFNRK